jgi:isovaleryl-CoA dehydrogenase
MKSLTSLTAAATEIAAGVVAANAEAEDREARWPEPAMQELADAGLLALNAPREVGGHDAGLTGLVAVSEILGRESGSTALCFAMHCVGTAVLAAKATSYQRERYLVPIAKGEHVTSLALSEPGTGSFFFIPQAELVPDGDGFRLSGTKSFVTNGGKADSYVVSTAASGSDEGMTPGSFSCVVADGDAEGMEWQEPWLGFGMRGNSSRNVLLRDVAIPRSNLLGAEGDQLWYVFEVVAPYFLMAMAGTYIGVAGGALNEAREHLASRRYAHSGELLGSSAVMAHRLGELWMLLEQTRRLVHSAAANADADAPDALIGVLASKAAAADVAVRITNEALTLCGGLAYRENSRLTRLLREARASHVMAPTTDMLKTWTGRAMLGLPLI